MRKQMQSMKKYATHPADGQGTGKNIKRNQAKYQKELMALYKREKVNPAGGCLPLLLTMPIFIALLCRYLHCSGTSRSLVPVDQRSLNNPILCFPFYLPGPQLGLSDSTFCRSLTAYTSISPKRKQIVDPKQAGMMQMMPVIFCFHLLELSFRLGSLLDHASRIRNRTTIYIQSPSRKKKNAKKKSRGREIQTFGDPKKRRR